jgi:hypothetical protein
VATAARFNMTRVPGLVADRDQTPFRVINDNFLQLTRLLERSIVDGGLIADGSVGESELSTAAKTLVGDVTGTIGSLGATVAKRLWGKTIPEPGAPEDQQIMVYDDGTDAFVWTTPFSDPLTTRGDVLRRGASATERLALGAANSVLYSDGTDVTYTTLLALMAAVLGSTQGQVLYHNGTNWTALAVGTAGDALTTGGAGADPSWSTILPSGTQGDVLYYNGSAWVVLAAGTSGQVLQTQGAGANPQWAAASGGGSPPTDFDLLTDGVSSLIFAGGDVVWIV